MNHSEGGCKSETSQKNKIYWYIFYPVGFDEFIATDIMTIIVLDLSNFLKK